MREPKRAVPRVAIATQITSLQLRTRQSNVVRGNWASFSLDLFCLGECLVVGRVGGVAVGH